MKISENETYIWNKSGIPRKGWRLVDVYDVRSEDESEDETEYETCMMCNNPKIRYVHIVEHDEVNELFHVGCICAENMTNDYINPKLFESKLKRKSTQKQNWLKRKWKTTNKGNHKLNYEGFALLIFIDRYSGKYKCKIGEQFGKHKFDTITQAKVAIYKGIEYYKSKSKK